MSQTYASIPPDGYTGPAAADTGSGPDPLAGARALIAEDEQRRMQACLADIEAALDRHRMTFHIEPARLTLVPKD